MQNIPELLLLSVVHDYDLRKICHGVPYDLVILLCAVYVIAALNTRRNIEDPRIRRGLRRVERKQARRAHEVDVTKK